jgi:anti-anti-sigma factor
VSGATATLALAGELTIYRAAELKAELLEAVQRGAATGTEIDLSGVTELDTCGVQLLMLAKRCAQEQGGALRLMGHSPAVLDAFELFDLAGWFGDPLVIAAA